MRCCSKSKPTTLFVLICIFGGSLLLLPWSTLTPRRVTTAVAHDDGQVLVNVPSFSVDLKNGDYTIKRLGKIEIDHSDRPSETVQGEISDDDFNASGKIIDFDEGFDLQTVRNLLPLDRPEWMGQAADLSSDTHYVTFATSPDTTLKKSLTSLGENALKEARKYILELADHNGFVATPESINAIELIDESYVMANWIKKGNQYDLVLDLPSGEYHQRWQRLEIDDKQQAIILEELHGQELLSRMSRLGGGLAVLIGGVFVFNFIAGKLARNSQTIDAVPVEQSQE